MASIQIENLPEDLYNQIQSLALSNSLTLNEAVIHLLQQAIQPNDQKVQELAQKEQTEPMAEILQRIRSRPRINPIEFGLPDSTALIREDRSR